MADIHINNYVVMTKISVIKRYIKVNILIPLYQQILVWRLKSKSQINVVFIASSLSMWRYQSLYELLSMHPRFNTSIIILPFKAYSKEQRNADVKLLMSFFNNRNIPYILASDSCVGGENELQKQNPDVLFYPQPYLENYESAYCYDKFKTRLLCYCPYAFWISVDGWSYNLPLQNYAWKLFYSTELHRKDARYYAFNKGRNIEVVGYPNADDFLSGNHKDVWKPQDLKKKRIIYAPHFTIFKGGLLEQSNFLWLGEFMQDVAEKYADKIQFVFKPHPRLFSELCRHDDWGKEKAKAYYDKWDAMENGQLQTGVFIDLFMTSDAMIHDSGSFSVEYHYSGKPVMYVADNIEEQILNKNELGEKAMRLHYIGKTKQDIIDFIENVVLKGEDPMKQEREQFKQDYLLPPNGKTVAQNMADVLINAFC